MPLYTYLDTSALMRRADMAAGSTLPRILKMEPFLLGIFADPDRVFALSEITLLEFHSNITTNLRSASLPDRDLEWWSSVHHQLLDEIGAGRISVLPIPPKATEQVIYLLTIATRDHGRALHAMDAMHAVIAGRWALTLNQDVEVLTSDSDFEAAILATNFQNRLKFSNLDQIAGTGEGFDKKNPAQAMSV